MAMAHRVPMVAYRLRVAWVLACVAGVFAGAQAGRPASFHPDFTATQTDSQSQTGGSSASSSTTHRKTGTNSGHHTRVAEEVGPPPELTQAEELIQKKDYVSAEPLLRKVVDDDPSNYEAWFDLGFVENGLGKVDVSIAAYRKSVAAKPDVFESNLNLGLQLAKSGQGDAEQFLRAATQLKPTNHVAEGQARAWLSLAHVVEAAKPEEAIAAYHEAAVLE